MGRSLLRRTTRVARMLANSFTQRDLPLGLPLHAHICSRCNGSRDRSSTCLSEVCMYTYIIFYCGGIWIHKTTSGAEALMARNWANPTTQGRTQLHGSTTRYFGPRRCFLIYAGPLVCINKI